MAEITEDSNVNKELDTRGNYTLIAGVQKDLNSLQEQICEIMRGGVPMGNGVIPDKEVFSSVAERDAYFLANIDADNALATGRPIIVAEVSGVTFEIWGNPTITDSVNYSALGWINPQSLTYTSPQVKSLYEANPDTNVFDNDDASKLDGIEENATADQTPAEIKTAYEANANTNVLTDALLAKLHASISLTEAKALINSTMSEKIKTGDGVSSDDATESFTFDFPFINGNDSDVTVIVQSMSPDFRFDLSVVASSKLGFDLDRASQVNGNITFSYFAFSKAAII